MGSTNTTMIAAVYREFGGPIRLERVPRPRCPPDGVVLQVRATGVCRSDWHGWRGHDADVRQHGLPFVPGHEVSGAVVECGNDEAVARQFPAGTRVVVPFILSCGTCHYCRNLNRPTVCSDQRQPGFTQWGSFAEYLAVPRAWRNLARIPDAVSFRQAAALGCRFATAHRAVCQQGRVLDSATATTSVAVFGCGGLGLSCIMLAAARGCATVIAVDVSERALRKAVQLGATHAILDVGSSDTDSSSSKHNVQEQVLRVTQRRGADVCIEASGFASACENAVRCTRPAGRMVQCGLVLGGGGDDDDDDNDNAHTSNRPHVPMDLVAAREIEILGSHGFDGSADLPHLLEMVASGRLDPGRLIDREVTLEEGARAISDMDRGSPLGITMVTKFPHDAASRL